MYLRHRTAFVVLATAVLLVGIGALVHTNYQRAVDAAVEQRAIRQLALTRAIALGMEVELGALAGSLMQLSAIPSVQQVDETFLPLRLEQGWSAAHFSNILAMVRHTPDGRRLAWRPGQRVLEPINWTIADEAEVWAERARHGESHAFLVEEGATAFADLVVPVYYTATSPAFPTATGEYLGWFALRIDIPRLSEEFFEPVSEGLVNTTLAVVAPDAGLVLHSRTAGAGGRRASPFTSPPSEGAWQDLAANRTGSGLFDTPSGSQVVAWASVVVPGLRLVVMSELPAAVAAAGVRSTFAHQLLPFGLLTGAVLAFAWVYLRSERSERRYRDLVDQAADGVFVVNPEGRLLETNAAARRLVDADRPFEGDAFVTLLAPDDRQAAAEALAGLRPGGRSTHQWRFTRASGEPVPVEVSLSRGAERRVLIVARDMSQRHELEAQLRQAQKVDAIGRLAGGIAHDFNNLLTAIIGYTDLLVDRLHHDAQGLQDAREIRRAADRAATLTRQLFAFGRKQMLRPSVVDLNAVLAGIGDMLRRLIGEHITLDVTPDRSLWRVEADQNQLEQVIVNLVLNARDAMPNGGRLTLSTSNATVDDGVLAPNGIGPGEYVLLTVADTGHGITAEHLPLLFEPFFTTRPLGQGTGLGLPMTHGIVSQSGGAIEVHSSPGAGATFRVWLPRTLKSDDGLAATTEPDPQPGRATVLLVEDEPMVRHLTATSLRRHGYTVVEAESPADALAIASTDGFDAVVSDVMMPGMSGPELAERLRQDRPDLPVLFVSGFVDAADHPDSRVPAGAPFLAKPFSGDALARALEQAMSGPTAVDVTRDADTQSTPQPACGSQGE